MECSFVSAAFSTCYAINLINKKILKILLTIDNVDKLYMLRNTINKSHRLLARLSDMNANTESVSSSTRNRNQKQLFRVRWRTFTLGNVQGCNTLFSLRFLADLMRNERRRKIKAASFVGIVELEMNRNC